MIGTIEQIINNQIEVKLAIDVKKTTNLINLYVLIKDTNKSFIGEITELSLTKCKVNILGKLENNDFIYGFDEDKVKVAIAGFSSDLDKLDASKVTADIDVAGLKEGEHTLKLKLNLAEEYAQSGNQTVTFTIEKK